MSRMALLIPILIAMVIGIVVLVGWLIWALTRRGRGASDQQLDPQASAPAAPVPQAAQPLYLLGIKRGTEGGWEVRVQGIRYTNLAAVPDPQLRAEVERAIRQLGAFLGRTAGPVESAAVPAGGVRTTVTPGVVDAALITESSARRVAVAGDAVPVIDFAQEITDIIEELQAGVPSLQGHAVNLQSVPGGGINFLVDGHIYADIAEIPHPELQALIRRATKEWERR